MSLKMLLAICAGTWLIGCAKHPDSIAPAYVSHVTYQSWTCRQLGEEAIRVNQALAVASGQQINARTNDTVGIILLGLPVSSLSGDNVAPQVANLKGTLDAIHQAATLKNCGLQIAALPPVMPPAPPPRTEMPGLPSSN